MKYDIHYTRLIDRARNRVFVGYSEKHHIVPRCLAGDDSAENLVRLTAEEHYVAHLLLMKMHPGDHKLLHAAWTMIRRSKFVAGRAGNKVYGWLRVRYSRQMREKLTGRKLSKEHRENIAAAIRKHTVPADQRKRMLEASNAAKQDADFRSGVSRQMKEKWAADQFRSKRVAKFKGNPKMQAATRERWKDPEYRAKMSGKKTRGTTGMKFTNETKAKMSSAKRGTVLPAAQKEKMRQSALARWAIRRAAATNAEV